MKKYEDYEKYEYKPPYEHQPRDKKYELIESVFGFIVYITTIFIGSSILAFAIVYLMNKYFW